MNKFYFAATAVIALVAADADGFPLRRFFKYAKPRKVADVNADPAEGIDAVLAEEKAWNPDKQESAIYDLVAHHPHVIVAGLLSRKQR